MLEKTGILFIILILLLVFYLVIRLGAGKKKDIAKSPQIASYLSGVRVLIIILAVVALILWFFLN
jgi:Mn2+/Fe2+ NRAMP family transporter